MSSTATPDSRPVKRNVAELREHPQPASVPPPQPDTQAALRAGVAANGVQVPLEITSAGAVLDGRARLQIARELAISHLDVVVAEPADEVSGEGFTVSDEPERDETTIADEILEAVLANGGVSWNKIDEVTTSKGERRRQIRDRLLGVGRLIDVGGKDGKKLWHVDDPARPVVQGAAAARRGRTCVRPGGNGRGATASLRPRCIGTQDAGTHPVPPSESDGAA
jgi:hypothetical protein